METAIRMRTLTRWCLVVAVNLALTIGCLSAAELYLRQKGLQPYIRTYPGQEHEEGRSAPWARLDPSLGWTIEPAVLAGEINPQGFRDTKDFESWPRHSTSTRIMMLGDSFVVGPHLNPDKILPRLLQAQLGEKYEVFSIAVPGWGIDQMYLAYQRYKDIINPDIVVLAFIDDDVTRVLEAYRVAERLKKPSLTVEDGKLIQQESVSPRRLRVNTLLGRSILLSLVAHEFYLATDAKHIVSQIFMTIGEEMKLRNGRMIVVRIPTRDDGASINRIRRYLRNFGPTFDASAVVFLDAAGELTRVPEWSTDLYAEDGHLNAVGTERLADYVLGHIRDR